MAEIQLKYRLADARFLEFASSVALNLQNDLLKFYYFDETITLETVKEISKTIEAIQSFEVKAKISNKISALEDTLAIVVNKCNVLCNKVTLSFSNCFIDNSLVQNQLYQNNVDRYNQDRIVEFMQNLNEIAQTHKKELIKSGTDPQLITTLSDLYNELLEISKFKASLSRLHHVIRAEEDQKLNELYDLLAPISAIARIIYADKPEKIDKYALPFPKLSTQNLDELVLQ